MYIGWSWTVYVHVVVSVVPSRMPGCKLQRSLIIDDREIHVRARGAKRTGKRSTRQEIDKKQQRQVARLKYTDVQRLDLACSITIGQSSPVLSLKQPARTYSVSCSS